MTEAELIALMATQIEAEAARRAVALTVVRAFQPTHEGRNLTGPMVYVFPVTAVRGGAQGQTYTNPGDRPDELDQNRKELWFTTFQFSARGMPGALDALDLLTVAWGTFNSDHARIAFRSAGCLPWAPGPIRHTYMQDEGARQEAHPSFDVTMGHHRSMVDNWPAIADHGPEFYPVN